jgi:antitoxin (DNA-binding transcriptional repressor) of toxin-antitoxin stability system
LARMSETVIDLRDVGRRLTELAPLIRAGKIITLCDANQPVAEIRPLPRRATGRRKFGLARGTFTVPDDFGAPDPDIERMFYGEPT